MFVDLGIQHTVRVRHIFIYGVSGSKIFFHISNGTILYVCIMCVCMYIYIYTHTHTHTGSYCKKNWARYDQKCILIFM